jgi:hypothetical protein
VPENSKKRALCCVFAHPRHPSACSSHINSPLCVTCTARGVATCSKCQRRPRQRDFYRPKNGSFDHHSAHHREKPRAALNLGLTAGLYAAYGNADLAGRSAPPVCGPFSLLAGLPPRFRCTRLAPEPERHFLFWIQGEADRTPPLNPHPQQQPWYAAPLASCS